MIRLTAAEAMARTLERYPLTLAYLGRQSVPALMPMRTPADVEAVLASLPIPRILARCRFEAAEAHLMGPQRP